MGLFRKRPPRTHSYLGGGGGGGSDKTNYRPAPKSCGACHGTGKKLNQAGRPADGRCSACGGRGKR